SALCVYENCIREYADSQQPRVNVMMQWTLEGLKGAEQLFIVRRAQERLPAALKGLRTKTLQAHLNAARTIVAPLWSDDDYRLFRERQRTFTSACYSKLLSSMVDAFTHYGPHKAYPDQAIYEGLSAILSRLLLLPEMLFDPDSTTPRAIQRRLSRL